MIHVECFADELLVKRMGFSGKVIRHSGDKGRVLSDVRQNPKAIGLIDEDPRSSQPGELEVYFEREKKRDLILLAKRDDEKKRLVRIPQFLEDWLLRRARANRISIGDYRLPDDPKKLHKILGSKVNQNFRRFLDDLINIDEEIAVMKRWLKEAL